ncbi:MAG: ATP-binding protein [Dehalococcoidia bacterium]|nr:ATP-binding protein [Dehalococcoidia bacterium]
MALCKICFQDVEKGILVPGHGEASGTVHEECLAAEALKVAEDSQKEGLLRYLVEYEEKHAPNDWARDVSGQSTDVCWEWTDVTIPATKIRSLLNAGLVSIVFSTNSSTYYSLVGRTAIKEALGKTEQLLAAPAAKLDIPDDLFDCIIGYDDIKDEIKFTLRDGREGHYLLIGPPATAKSLFLMEVARLGGTYQAAGSRVSGAGLTDAFFSYQPRILLLDEIDKIPMDATAVLLSVMESGDVLETKYKRHRGLKLKLTVFAAGNSDKTVPPELLSRFDTKLYFSAYSFEEFVSVCQGYLSRYESVPEPIAEYVGVQTWQHLDRDVRTARGITRRLRESSREDVDRVVGFLRKYQKRQSVSGRSNSCGSQESSDQNH